MRVNPYDTRELARGFHLALSMSAEQRGVLHAHANVKQGELEGWISRLEAAVADLAAKLGREWSVRVEHVERVKWYAPRIRHLVADVGTTRCSCCATPASRG